MQIIADVCLWVLWSTVAIKVEKKNKNKEEERKRRRHVNGSYCWVITFRLLACKCCRRPGEQTIKTFKKNPREAQVTESYFISKTSKAIKSSLKINYTHLCLNSCYVQVFLSDSQNTFSQWLILIDHNNRNKFFRNHTKREKKRLTYKLPHNRWQQESLVCDYAQH